MDKNDAAKLERAKVIIAAAESQSDIPSAQEARRRMKRYNDVYNEGRYGYVPHIYSCDEYNAAKAVVAQYPNSIEED